METDNSRLRALRWVLPLLIPVVGGIGCARQAPGLPFLEHWVVDPAPDAGDECCSDILILADINRDGATDIVLGSQGAHDAGLVWYEFPSWRKHAIARGEFTTDGTAADMDGDGDVDLVIGKLSSQPGRILWFENPGIAEVEAWLPHAVGDGYAHDVGLGDLDNDGDFDVVSCDKKSITVWEALPDRTFVPHAIAHRPGEGIALADLDRDGQVDIVFGGTWLRNPGTLNGQPWVSHTVAPGWPADTRVALADLSGDGRTDIALSVSEGDGRLSWFEAPERPIDGLWKEHPIEREALTEVHSLQIGDIDGDGDADVVAAEMHTSPKRLVRVYLNEGGTFRAADLSYHGSHNMRLGDLDADGDLDLVGKNYGGRGRAVELWENHWNDAWTYHPVDTSRPKSEEGKMGLCFPDLNADGFPDIAAGAMLYLNPAGRLDEPWPRISLPSDVDVITAIPGTEKGRFDLLALRANTLVRLDGAASAPAAVTITAIADLAPGRTQGCALAKLIPAQNPQIVFSHGKHLYCLEVPDGLTADRWKLHTLSDETEEEGVAAADLDGDGDIDLAAVAGDGTGPVWLENPGSLKAPWKVRRIGSVGPWTDRIALADVDRDGHVDLIATAERQDWNREAELVWFRNSGDPQASAWTRHGITKLRSLNSMDVADFDGNGLIDIAVAEHTDQANRTSAEDNLTTLWLNIGGGRAWSPRIVERGPHSSHLGARAIDLDRDGNPELVSTAWSQYRTIHTWMQARRSPPAP